MARYFVLWLISLIYFMLLNLPIYFYYDLKFGIFFTLCGNLAAFTALLIEIGLHITHVVKKSNGNDNNTVL